MTKFEAIIQFTTPCSQFSLHPVVGTQKKKALASKFLYFIFASLGQEQISIYSIRFPAKHDILIAIP